MNITPYADPRCWGCDALPPSSGKFQCCSKCREEGLPPSFFCSRKCLLEHWPRHKKWHLEQQKQKATLATLAKIKDPAMRADIAQAKKNIDQAAQQKMHSAYVAAMAKAEEHRTARRFAEAIASYEEAAAVNPEDPRPYFQMCSAQAVLGDTAGACRSALLACEHAPGQQNGVLPSERHSGGGDGVPVPRGVYPQIGLRAAIMAFDLLIRAPCDSVPRPRWWNDGALLKLSERALIDTPASPYALSVRAHVLAGVTSVGADGRPRGWPLGQRTGAQLREAAMLLARQAQLEPTASSAATEALARSASLLEAAVQLEAEEAKAKAAEEMEAGPRRAATPVSPPRPSAGRTDGSARSAELRAQRVAIEEQLAALERQLADSGVVLS